MRTLALAALTLAGCSAGAEPDDTGCKNLSRDGTYLIVWQPLSGDCTTPDTQVSRGDPQGLLPSGCSTDQPERWSDDWCSLERAYSCPRTVDTGRFSVVEAITQGDNGVFTSAATVTVRDPAGAQVCKGTFAVTYARQ